MKQTVSFTPLDLSVLVNSKIGALRDEKLEDINFAEAWLNQIFNQSLEQASHKKKVVRFAAPNQTVNYITLLEENTTLEHSQLANNATQN